MLLILNSYANVRQSETASAVINDDSIKNELNYIIVVQADKWQ